MTYRGRIKQIFLFVSLSLILVLHIELEIFDAARARKCVAENVTNQEAKSLVKKKRSPRSVILWTSWRSGSTYTGEILANALPDTFYSYEPLHFWGVNKFHENSTKTAEVRRFLRGLVECNIEPSYAKAVLYLSKKGFYMNANKYLSKNCKRKAICGDTNYVNQICQQANMHFIKLIRLSVRWARALLEDDNLDLQIIFMARDPRAVLESRTYVGWCRTITCRNPERVCEILYDDLKEAKSLALEFPHKFKIIQYERLSGDLRENLEDLMSFLGLKVSNLQENIINSKRGDPKKPYGTRKDYEKQVNLWRTTADFKHILAFQNACMKPLSELGLRIFRSEKEFLNLSLNLLV